MPMHSKPFSANKSTSIPIPQPTESSRACGFGCPIPAEKRNPVISRGVSVRFSSYSIFTSVVASSNLPPTIKSGNRHALKQISTASAANGLASQVQLAAHPGHITRTGKDSGVVVIVPTVIMISISLICDQREICIPVVRVAIHVPASREAARSVSATAANHRRKLNLPSHSARSNNGRRTVKLRCAIFGRQTALNHFLSLRGG